LILNNVMKMKIDIFIDNNIVKNFASAKDFEYIKLIVWLMQLSKYEIDCIFSKLRTENKEMLYSLTNKDKKPYLAISKKLHEEYLGGAMQAKSFTAINNLLLRLKSDGNRFNEIKSVQIQEFINERRKIFDNLNYLKKDKEHIPIVLLSDRKYALTYDKDFTDALINFPGYKDMVKVEKRPENLRYDE